MEQILVTALADETVPSENRQEIVSALKIKNKRAELPELYSIYNDTNDTGLRASLLTKLSETAPAIFSKIALAVLESNAPEEERLAALICVADSPLLNTFAADIVKHAGSDPSLTVQCEALKIASRIDTVKAIELFTTNPAFLELSLSERAAVLVDCHPPMQSACKDTLWKAYESARTAHAKDSLLKTLLNLKERRAYSIVESELHTGNIFNANFHRTSPEIVKALFTATDAEHLATIIRASILSKPAENLVEYNSPLLNYHFDKALQENVRNLGNDALKALAPHEKVLLEERIATIRTHNTSWTGREIANIFDQALHPKSLEESMAQILKNPQQAWEIGEVTRIWHTTSHHEKITLGQAVLSSISKLDVTTYGTLYGILEVLRKDVPAPLLNPALTNLTRDNSVCADVRREILDNLLIHGQPIESILNETQYSTIGNQALAILTRTSTNQFYMSEQAVKAWSANNPTEALKEVRRLFDKEQFESSACGVFILSSIDTDESRELVAQQLLRTADGYDIKKGQTITFCTPTIKEQTALAEYLRDTGDSTNSREGKIRAEYGRNVLRCFTEPELNITSPFSLDPAGLAEVLRVKSIDPRQDPRPVVRIIAPCTDENNALSSLGATIRKFTDLTKPGQDCPVRIEYDESAGLSRVNVPGTSRTLPGLIELCTDPQKKPSQVLILVGHGNGTHLSFSGTDPQRGTADPERSLSIYHLELLKQSGVEATLASGGRVIAISCDGGSAEPYYNLGEMLRELFKHAKSAGIQSFEKSTNIKEVKASIGTDGELKIDIKLFEGGWYLTALPNLKKADSIT